MKNKKPTWCLGCGNYGLLFALKSATKELKIAKESILLVSGIGCGSLIPYFTDFYGACTLHGRAIPFATGAKIANQKMTVIVNMGDGDCLGIGIGHYLHFFRRNLDITIIINNNGVYGLTKGQTAPTAKKGTKTVSTPFGSIEDFVNAEALALESGASFIARSFTGNVKHLKETLKSAISHKGSSIVNVLDPCVSFNKIETNKFYQERVEEFEKSPIENKVEAYEFLTKKQEKIPIGIFYKKNKKTYCENLPQIKNDTFFSKYAENIDTSNFFDTRS